MKYVKKKLKPTIFFSLDYGLKANERYHDEGLMLFKILKSYNQLDIKSV